jgi:hypothetical protein
VRKWVVEVHQVAVEAPLADGACARVTRLGIYRTHYSVATTWLKTATANRQVAAELGVGAATLHRALAAARES